MALYLNTNVASLRAQNSLNKSQFGLQKSFERLSSGFRINVAADDAAGMAVSESMRSQIRSYGVAERNANNAISMTNTAEGGLSEISNLLIRMRELAVQAANGDLTSVDRGYIDTEFQELILEIGRVAETTEFNGTELLAGAATAIDFQVGIYATGDDVVTVNFGAITTTTLGVVSAGVGGATASASLASLSSIDTALGVVTQRRAENGAKTNRLQVAVSATQTIRTNLEAANSVIRDVDVAKEASELARNNVLLQAGTAILAQANQAPQLALTLLR